MPPQPQTSSPTLLLIALTFFFNSAQFVSATAFCNELDKVEKKFLKEKPTSAPFRLTNRCEKRIDTLYKYKENIMFCLQA